MTVAMVSASRAIVGGHSVQADSLAKELTAEGVDVRRIAIDRRFPAPVAALRRVRGLRTVINECLYAVALKEVAGADVVHAFSASYWSFLLSPVPAMIAGRAAGCRVVLHYHSGEVADHLDRWGRLVHPWLKLADEIVVCSSFQAEAFGRHGYDVTVIPNIVDLSMFAFRERRPIAPRFVCTRNLEPIYGIDVVLDAFAMIASRFPLASLVIAGSGSQQAALEAQAARAGLTGVAFVGPVAPARMPELLSGRDIYLNASTVDNQPVSLIEAQACGLAIVSTPTGGITDFIEHGVTGQLVPPNDPRAMAEAACELLEAPERASAMAERGRSESRRFTWEAVRTRWARAYGLPGDAVVHAATQVEHRREFPA